MKKILSFITVAALLLPAAVSAQDNRGLAVGVKGGLMYGAIMGKSVSMSIYNNIEKRHYSDFKSLSYISGLASVYADYRLNDSWAFGSEVGFTVIKEREYERRGVFFRYDFAYESHNRPELYITPIIVKYYIPKAKGLHLTLGPELNINLGNRYFKEGHYVGGGRPGYRLYKYNPVTLAITPGIGYRFGFGMTLQAEYSAGVTRVIHKTSDDNPHQNLYYRDGMFRFSLSYDLFKRRK